jgi:transglutaminase-like putative cysteine protease
MMKTLAHKGSASVGIRRFANSYWGMNVRDALLRLDADIRHVFRYRGEINEMIRTPEFMIADLETYGFMEGDCDDIATFMGSVCKSLGIDCRFVAIRTNPYGDDFKHVFAQGNTGAEWIRLDPTVQRDTVLEYYGQPMIETI